MSDDKNLPELSKDAEKILEMIEKLSVLELAALVKNMEDKFGVSAAAPVAVAAAGGAAAAGGGDAGAPKDAFTVVLKSAGQQKINVIKVLRELTGLGLKEAKDMADGAPQNVKENVKESEANDMKKKLEEVGAEVELQ